LGFHRAASVESCHGYRKTLVRARGIEGRDSLALVTGVVISFETSSFGSL
jgi:hypothetical protein